MAIPVTVDCSANPREVKAILLKVAEDNPNVVATPAPSVALEDFGDSLNLKLYAFYEVNKDVGTDLASPFSTPCMRRAFAKWRIWRSVNREKCQFDDAEVHGPAPRLLRRQESGAHLGSRVT